MKYNCVILNNEIWQLHNRLKYDLEWFDKVIIVESNKTFSGCKKPFFLEKYSDIFKDFKDRIIYKKNRNLPLPIKGNFLIPFSFKGENIPIKENRWHVEHASRAFAKQCLHLLLNENDFICFQDVDEIASHEALSESYQSENYITMLKYFNYKSHILSKNSENDWVAGFCGKYKHLKHFDFHDLRHFSNFKHFMLSHVVPSRHLCNADGSNIYPRYKCPLKNITISKKYGWHFSNMNGCTRKASKIKADCFAHAEFSKSKPTDLEIVTEEALNELLNNSNFAPQVDKDIPSFLKSTKFYSCYFNKKYD